MMDEHDTSELEERVTDHSGASSGSMLQPNRWPLLRQVAPQLGGGLVWLAVRARNQARESDARLDGWQVHDPAAVLTAGRLHAIIWALSLTFAITTAAFFPSSIPKFVAATLVVLAGTHHALDETTVEHEPSPAMGVVA